MEVKDLAYVGRDINGTASWQGKYEFYVHKT